MENLINENISRINKLLEAAGNPEFIQITKHNIWLAGSKIEIKEDWYRATNSYIRGTNGTTQGAVYFWKLYGDMLAAVNGGYDKAYAASYGLFNNEAEMALNLGFSGFRRGSYDFYKTDWKYLNDASTRGLTGDIDGVLIPAGTSTVYDQMLGQNIRRPFLHVRYRASEADDRRMKSWVVGSVGGAYTSGLDAMQIHFLSERCLCVQGANNFVLFKSTV
jgi:hypothetical protein